MKKSIKLITLIISAILLIGAVIGISVSAEGEAPTVAIKYKNLAYEGAIQVLYAVEAENLPEGAKLQMYFYDAEPTEDSTPAYVKDEYTDEALTIGGKTYRAFFSRGIAPKNMRKSIFAVPVIVNGDAVVAKGECVEYSIYTYAINMFAKSPTEEQKELYTNLLDYGASVQRVLLGTEDYTADDLALAGGYADEYCGVKVSTVVDNVIVEEGEFLGYFAPETAIELTADLYEGDATFTGFKDTKLNSVGDYSYAVTAYTSEPGVAGFYKTYSSQISTETYNRGFITASAKQLYRHISNDESYTNNYYVGNANYNAIVNYGSEAEPNYAIKHTHTEGKDSGAIHYMYETLGSAYIFEADFCFEGTEGASASNNWQGRIGFVSDATNGRNSEKNFTAYTYMYATDNADMTIEGAVLPIGKWVRMRFEYIPLGYYRDAYRALFRIYADGVLVSEKEYTTDVSNYDCMKFQIGSRNHADAGSWSMMFDNTVCYTIIDDYYGKGLYKDLADTYDSDKTYANATVVDEIGGNKVLEFYSANKKSPSLTFSLDEAQYGATYVFDTDIQWTDMSLDGYVRSWMARFGFVTPSTDAYAEDDKFARSNALSGTPVQGGLIGVSSNGNYEGTTLHSKTKLNPGTWYNLRIEYTPLGADADGYYSGTQKIYLNGVLISDVTQREVITSKYQSTRGVIKNNVGLKAFAINTLSHGSCEFRLDNTYLGVVGESEDYRINDFANTVNKNSSYPTLTLSEKDDCVTSQTIVANTVATESKSLANNILKVAVSNTGSQCTNTINPTETGETAQAHGVYELELDMMFDSSNALPTDGIIQQFVVHSSGGYVQLYRLTHTENGIVKFHAETGGTGGGKGGDIGTATILDGKWHNIRFVYYKNGEDSALAIYVDGELIGARANTYYMTESAVTKSTPINSVTWRIKPYTSSTDTTEAIYYFDNVSLTYKGDVPEVIPELAK